MKRKYIIALCVVPCVLALDQWIKGMVRGKMSIGQNITVIEDFFSLHYLVNSGAAFGMLKNMNAVFFLAISVLALAMIVYYLVTAEDHKIFFPVCLALVLGGAAGNVTDRIIFGHVTDFALIEASFMGDWVVKLLDKYAGSHYWPSFNVADTAIVTGIIGMAIDMLFFTPIEKPEAEEKRESEDLTDATDTV